jgi:hypothetical protein
MISGYLLSIPGLSKVSINEVSELDMEMLKSFSSSFIELEKSKEYIDWRFTKNPKNKYYYLRLIKNREVIGYVIYKKLMHKHEISEIMLRNPESLKESLQAFNNFSLKKLVFISSLSYLDNNYWKQNLPKLMLKRNSNIFLTVKFEDRSFNNPDNWLIQGGDIQ